MLQPRHWEEAVPLVCRLLDRVGLTWSDDACVGHSRVPSGLTMFVSGASEKELRIVEHELRVRHDFVPLFPPWFTPKRPFPLPIAALTRGEQRITLVLE